MRACHRYLVAILFVCAAVSPMRAQVPTIATYAGGGLPTPGPATATGVSLTSGMGMDPAGNLYFVSYTGTILKVTPAGTLSIYAGTGPCCFSGDGGPATSAKLSIMPTSPPPLLKTDPSGNVYIVDLLAQVVRRIDHITGIITTVAGTPYSTGFSGAGGPATSAQISPDGLGFDAAGDLFISDFNGVVWRVDHATQIITIVAGNGTLGYSGDGGPATSAQLESPTGLAIDGVGNLFIADEEAAVVRRVDAVTHIITTYAGGGNTYPPTGVLATQAELDEPAGLAFDLAGNLIIADSVLPAVLRVNKSTQNIAIIAGDLALGPGFSGDGGPATSAQLGRSTTPCFCGGMDVGVDASGNIFVTDQINYRVRRIDAASQIITTAAGNGGVGDGGPATQALLFTSGLAHDSSGNVFIGDIVDRRVRRVDAATGLISTVAGKDVGTSGGYGGAATAKQLNNPGSVALDSFGDLFISDSENGIIQEVNGSTGIIALFAGTAGSAGFGGDGGPATSAKLNIPRGVAVDREGNLYIADQVNNVIRKVDASTGVITTTVGNTSILSNGTPVGGYSGDGGPETSAQLLRPFGGTLDSAGNGFIADRGNNVIRRAGAGAAGVITTIVGNHMLGPGFSGDNGPATLAQLNSPATAALDVFGNLYISDSGNYRIRVVNAVTGIITTLAGNGNFTFGGDGGPAADASLYPYETGLTVLDPDETGNIRVLVMDGTSGRTRVITIPPVPAIFLKPVVATFGNLAVGNTSAPQFVTIANSGTGTLDVTNIAVTGPDGADFALGAGGTCVGTSFALAPTASCTFAVTFKPTSSNEQNATVTITDNSAGSPHTVSLQGNVQALINVVPDSVTFLGQVTGTTSSPTTVTLTNVGDAALLITKIGATAGFAETDNCIQATGIAPGNFCTVNVTFTPAGSGVTKGTLTITSNATGSPQAVPLQGTGGSTVAVSSSIPVGHSPQQAVMTPNGAEVYVTNSGDNTVSVINTATNTVTFTLPVGVSPSSLAVSPDGSNVYVGGNGGGDSVGSVSIINTATKTVTIIATDYPVRQLALTPDGTKVYLAMEVGGLWQLATATNSLSQVSATTCPEGVGVTPNGSTLYVNYQCGGPGGSSGHDAIGIFNPTTNAFLTSITGLPNVGGFERISPNGQQLWEVGSDACSSPAYDHVGCPSVPGVPESVVNVIGTSSNTLIQSLGGLGSGYLSFFPDSAHIFLSTGTVLQIVDTKTFAVVDTLPLAGSGSVAFTPDGSHGYAPVPSQNAVAILSTGASFPMSQTITQPLSPSQPNQFNFTSHTFGVQYPPGTNFSGVNMTVNATQTSQATFASRVAGTQFANASCIQYTGGGCVDYAVTCTNTSGGVIACPSESTPSINVKSSYDTLQPITNPGFLTAPIGTNNWTNIFTAFYEQRIDPTTRGRTVAFSEFFAVDLGTTNGQGAATLQFEDPLQQSDSREFPVGTAIPVKFQLASIAHPGTFVTDAVAGIAVVMVADGQGNPVSNVVLENATAFTFNGGNYGYSLNTTGYAPGTYNVTVYGNAFAAQQVQFTLPAPTTSAHLVTTLQSLTLNTSTNQYVVVLGFANPGTTAANGLLVTAAQINGISTATALPLSVGDVGSGATTTATLTFPASAGAPATRGVLSVNLSYAGGTAGAGFRITLP